MTVQVARCGPENRPDFYRVHCAANDTGWCFCVAWWVPTWDGWGERTAEQNRVLRESLFEQGEYDGYLLYVDHEPVGWYQAGPRDRLEKLCRVYELTPDPAAWAITCFVMAPHKRRQGLSGVLLAEALRDLAARGVGYVQAFPKRGAQLDAGDLWRGPEAIYQQAGFTLERDHAQLPVYGKWL